jgi:hypothetical protein
MLLCECVIHPIITIPIVICDAFLQERCVNVKIAPIALANKTA